MEIINSNLILIEVKIWRAVFLFQPNPHRHKCTKERERQKIDSV